ncbi:MAG: transglutaminase-like domain-containing protein [Alphaproteobacteria bacterium]
MNQDCDNTPARFGRDAARAELGRIGALDDNEIDIAETALVLATFDRPRIPLTRYRHHVSLLAGDVAREFVRAKGSGDNIDDRAQALKTVLHDQYGYRGDELTYDDIQNANLMRVVDRQKGLPVALGVLYIHAARAQGWEVSGLNFPAHFLICLDHLCRRVVIDPYTGNHMVNAREVLDFLKGLAGSAAELKPAYYTPISNRDILLRLQNNIKARLVGANRLEDAITVVEHMLMFAPGRATLWHEIGLLQAKLGQLGAAVGSLETFIAHTGNDEARHKAAKLLQELRSAIN